MRPRIISADLNSTLIECPKCKKSIILTHADTEEANSGIGRLDLGEQYYDWVVCMNKHGGEYCSYSGSFINKC